MNAELPLLIVEPSQLAQVCEHFAHSPWLALDTEFVREDTYHPELCLIQIGDAQSCTVIDVKALSVAALKPLLALLAGQAGSSAAIKLFHAASQDLEIFVRLLPAGLSPIFDTQLAAALLGDGDQLGYAALVEKRIGIKLDKSLTRTNWARRPLTPAEVAYALDDVRYLAEIYPQLLEGLEQRGRLAWLQEDCQRLADPDRYRVRPEQAWRRLKGIGRLAHEAQTIVVALAAWREEFARAKNRPRKWVLEDDAIYRIAERRPQSLAQLADLRVLPPKTLERHGQILTMLVQQALDAAAAGRPSGLVDEAPLTNSQKNRLRDLQETVRALAESLEIPAGLLGPRADLETLVRQGAQADIPLLCGWRRQVAGEAILAQITGA